MQAVEWAAIDLQADGVTLDVVTRDSRGDAERAAELVAELGQDPEILAVLGPVGARESRLSAPMARDLELPLLTLTSAEGVEDLGESVFRLRLAPEDQARALARLAYRELGVESAAVFYPDNGYGSGCMRAFVDAFDEAGGRVTAIESYDPTESRPKEAAEALAGKRVRRVRRGRAPRKAPGTALHKRSSGQRDFDALFIPDSAPAVGRDLAFLELAGLDTGGLQLLGTSAWMSGGLEGTEGRAAGALVAGVFDPERDDRVADHVVRFEELFERRPSELDAQVRDGVVLLGNVAKGCRDRLSRSCLVQRLRSSPQIDGVSGPVGLTRSGGLRRDLLIFDVDSSGTLWPAW